MALPKASRPTLISGPVWCRPSPKPCSTMSQVSGVTLSFIIARSADWSTIFLHRFLDSDPSRQAVHTYRAPNRATSNPRPTARQHKVPSFGGAICASHRAARALAQILQHVAAHAHAFRRSQSQTRRTRRARCHVGHVGRWHVGLGARNDTILGRNDGGRRRRC